MHSFRSSLWKTNNINKISPLSNSVINKYKCTHSQLFCGINASSFRFMSGKVNTKNNPFDAGHSEDSQYWKNKRMEARSMPMGDIALYLISLWITMFGAAYASAPLYRSLCGKFGWGGAISRKTDSKLANLIKWRKSSTHKKKNRKLLIRFDTRTGPGMDWEFEPVQSYVVTRPGESTLAFFKATNTANEAITGLSTYTILPFKAAPYFVKIQCFCFEEQRLRAKEEVDMPVLFFVEPSFLDDTSLQDVDEITLSYIFYPVMDDDGPVEYDNDDEYEWDNSETIKSNDLQPTNIENIPQSDMPLIPSVQG